MSADIPENADSRSGSFRQITDAFLSQDGLPFSEVLTAEKIQNVFGRNGGLFGLDDVYSTMIVVWAFLSQVLKDGKEASCPAAVARVVGHCLAVGVELAYRGYRRLLQSSGKVVVEGAARTEQRSRRRPGRGGN